MPYLCLNNQYNKSLCAFFVFTLRIFTENVLIEIKIPVCNSYSDRQQLVNMLTPVPFPPFLQLIGAGACLVGVGAGGPAHTFIVIRGLADSPVALQRACIGKCISVNRINTGQGREDRRGARDSSRRARRRDDNCVPSR